MTAIGTELAADILSLVNEYGRTITLTKVTSGTYDEETATTSGGSSTNYTGKGILLSYNDREIDGTRIQARDRKCIIAATGFSVVPTPGDRITVSSVIYQIVPPLRTYELQGVSMAYVCQVRDAGPGLP